MMKNKLKELVKKPEVIFLGLGGRGVFNWMSNELYLKIAYKLTFNRGLDLNNPRSYNEKLQWLKLYDHKSNYVKMVDKYEVKEYVASIIGEQYIIPTIGVWNDFDEIDFASLPSQFVLKCTHDSGGLVICKDKSKLDYLETKKKISKCLKKDYYWQGREWPYKSVPHRIIAERYIHDDDSEQLTDYKVYTFNGEAKMIMINKDRGNNTKADYFDRDFNWLEFTWGYQHSKELPQKPYNFELMLELAEKLSKDIPELRVDFYEVDSKVYFGELTFFDGSGFDKIEPIEWDYRLGEWIKLPCER